MLSLEDYLSKGWEETDGTDSSAVEDTLQTSRNICNSMMYAVTSTTPVRLRRIVANLLFEWDAEMWEISVGFLKKKKKSLIDYDSHLVGSSFQGTCEKRLAGACQLCRHTRHRLHRGFQTDTALT